MGEYDPLFASAPSGDDDLEPVRERFRRASRPFLQSPWSWFAWAVLLPVAALATPAALRQAGPAGALFTWSAAILLGGIVEFTSIRRAGGGLRSSALASAVLRIQGNLSMVALALSVLLVWQESSWAIPGLWLLLLGHSFFMLGGLALGTVPRLRRALPGRRDRGALARRRSVDRLCAGHGGGEPLDGDLDLAGERLAGQSPAICTRLRPARLAR